MWPFGSGGSKHEWDWPRWSEALEEAWLGELCLNVGPHNYKSLSDSPCWVFIGTVRAPQVVTQWGSEAKRIASPTDRICLTEPASSSAQEHVTVLSWELLRWWLTFQSSFDEACFLSSRETPAFSYYWPYNNPSPSVFKAGQSWNDSDVRSLCNRKASLDEPWQGWACRMF